MTTPPDPSSLTSLRYTAVAVFLHWLMAIAFLLMLASGLTMEFASLERSFKFQLFQWHKSLGVILLWLVAIRILWRLTHRPPALPDHFPWWEKWGAHLGHLALYGFMIVMPLSGWAIVSSSSFGLPTYIFGLFEWPHIPGIASNDAVQGWAKFVHWWAAWFFIATILLHAGAVVKHAVWDHENLLKRMWFGGSK